ncbi:MAG TPA: thermonuclease family protein [Candidatus Binatia bacterium]
MRVKILFLLGLLAAAAIEVGSTSRQEAPVGISEQSRESRQEVSEKRLVIRVIDGDTIVVSPNEKVRLIGVDTPETVHPNKTVQCFGKDAKEFTRSMVERKSIRLVLDESNAARNHKDRYGRTLAYVYFDDGTMLNAELIRRGYAHAYTRFPFRHVAEFREMERAARNQAVGLWASCQLNSSQATGSN